jgi:hypothetical protein
MSVFDNERKRMEEIKKEIKKETMKNERDR